MAHYALLDLENNVVSVFVGRDEEDLIHGVENWEDYYAPEGFAVKRTSYNTYGGQHAEGGTPFRFNYASEGYTFDSSKGTDGAFIPPKPYPSWVLDETTCLWEAPVALPDDADTVAYVWDEEAGAWVAATEDEVE